MTPAASSLALSPVDRRSVKIGAGRVVRPLPMGLAARIARAAHEAIGRVVPSNSRPAIMLDWEDGSVRLEPDEDEIGRALSDALGREIGVHRGREGGRLVVLDDSPAFLNGWPVARGIPQLLGHGDIIRLDERFVAVRYDPPVRALVEVGATFPSPPPRDIAPGFRFALEPGGEPLDVRCEPAITRALVATVLRHGSNRPFDPTALTDVERATLDWLVHRIADRVAGDVFGSRLSMRPAASGAPPETWTSAAMRINGTHGAIWVGTSHAGLATLTTTLEPVTRLQRAVNPAVRGVHVTLSARVEIGRIPAVSAATLAAGDLLVARDVAWLDGEDWSGRGRLVLFSADELNAPARLEMDAEGRMRAVLLSNADDNGGDPMVMTEMYGAIADEDHPFGDALDAIGVVVAVEVARRRIRLSEALAISTGDVIELGEPVATSVSLMIDGAPFARGELVDVEGALGVRIVATGGRR